MPHPTLGRWLTLELARYLGVAAHQRIELPAQFAWSIMRGAVPTLPREQPFAPERLRWRVFEALADTRDAPVRRYLFDGDPCKRFGLATRLARVYDRCLLYRPDWIRAWEAGETPHWQARLWQRLTAEDAGRPHWVAAVDAFHETAWEPPASWPGRVSFFGLGMLSPSYLDVLRRVEGDIDVHLFLLSPCREYWSDIAPKRVIRRRADPLDPADDYRTEGNEILAALGKPARDMQALLAERELAIGAPDELYDPPGEATVLGQVQQDILDLRTAAEGAALKAPTQGADSSLQIHVCHSAVREAEVLHDRLLALFDEHDDIEPADVLVVTPSLADYGPPIESVFATAGRIPFHVARPPAGETRGLRALIDLLALPGSRYGAEAVLAPLECASVRARFGIPEERLADVRDWVRAAGIRWGVDAAHRRDEDLPATEGHGWRLGLKRLLLGYAMEGTDALFAGIAPCPVRDWGLDPGPEDFELLGRFVRYCDAAFALRDWLDEACVAGEWGTRLREGVVEGFFAGEDRTYDAEVRRETAAVQRAIGEFETQCAVDAPVPFPVLREALAEAVQTQGGAVARLADGVTVTGLGAGQTFPAKVVCAVGMNDRGFPRSPGAPTFDVLAADDERRGDRNVRDEDRLAFLETLLAARRAFVVTYTGRGLRDDAAIPPSVVVDELREYLDARLEGGDVEVRHPLQPFSVRYFDGSERDLFSYSQHMLEAAEAVSGATGAVAGARMRAPAPDAGEPSPAVDLDALVRFFGDPAKWFLQRRLQARLEVEDVAVLEEEPFGLDGLASWQLRDRMWELVRAGVPFDRVVRVAAAEPTLPEAGLGRMAVQDAEGAVSELAQAMAEHREALAAPARAVDLPCGGLRVTGAVEGIDADAGYVLCWRIGSIRPKDRVAAWLKLLAWAAGGGGTSEKRACLLGLGRNGVEVEWLEAPGGADGPLGAWLDAWTAGQSRLLPFAPKTAWAYASAAARPKGREDAAAARARGLRAAESEWFGGLFGFPESRDPYAALAYDGGSPLGREFRVLAEELLFPVVHARTEVT